MLRTFAITLLVFSAAECGFAAEIKFDFLSTPAARQDRVIDAGLHSESSGGLLLTGCDAGDCWTPCDACIVDDCAGLCAPEPAYRIRFGLPAWLPEMHGNATVRGRQAPVDVTTRELFELVDDVKFAVVGRVEVESGRWGVLAEGGYINIGVDQKFLDNRINLSAGTEQAIVDAIVTYDVQEQLFGDDLPNGFTTELLAGARYWRIGSNGVTISDSRGNSRSTASGTRDWVDPIIGGRVAVPLADDLLLRTRADIGGFGAASDFAWNIEAVGEYRCSDCCGLQLGYRVLDVDYASGDFAYDVNYRGPIATLVFDF